MPKVRVRNWPDREIEVSEEELTDLRRFGILIEDDKQEAEDKPTARNKNKEG